MVGGVCPEGSRLHRYSVLRADLSIRRAKSMAEPQTLSGALADYVARAPEGSRRQQIGRQMLRAREANQQRRAAVLRHPELAAELTRPPLSFARPGDWTGYIPPALAVDDTGEVLRQVMTTGRVYLNPKGLRSCGPVWNETPQRAVLLALSAAAWELEHPGEDADGA